MNARESGMASRRQAIVAAARRLVRDTGGTGFSMRALAEAAGVSIATPYNLLGSKQAIMIAVLDADLERYRARLEALGGDALDVLFQGVTLVRTLYAEDPAFYRALLFAVYNDGGREFRSIFGPPRHALWRSLVSNAVDAGFLDPALDPDAFAVNLGHTFFAVILEWVAGELELDELEARVHYGFALALHSMATPAARLRLRQQVEHTQGRLTALWQARTPGCQPAADPRKGPHGPA